MRVHMRGLPFRATAHDVEEFFHPLTVVDVLIGYNPDGRPSGDGAVDFESAQDAEDAMSRNQNLMGKRYIELFPGYGVYIFVISRFLVGRGGKGHAFFKCSVGILNMNYY